MKNKIIILLMFVLVVVLAAVAWQSFTTSDESRGQESGNDELIIENAEKQRSKPEEEIKETEYVPPEVSPTIDSSNEMRHDVQDEERDEEGLDPKLCELVETYDDWQKTSTGYTSQKLIDEIRNWGDRRGYFEMEYNGSRMEIKKTSDYDYYETEDLRQMADAGDTIANVKMAYRLFLKGDEASLEEAQPYCERAIVDGYSAMHGCVITYVNNLLTHHENQEEPNIKRIEELQVESQAWKRMYELRHDPLGEIMFEGSLSEIEGVEVTDEEIELRTKQLYQDLVRKRVNLGLGPFLETPAPKIIVYAVQNGVNDGDIEQCFETDLL
ncbi:hypothetical protein [Kangiella koreensis]|uniref:Uncharacterized protein n=1 Tax=Kangiella koreensis (strain DSM 16069 / JCM 12317 / KCTC 12182 / SW-125) TaxID=523791 RepID=C7R984_KANKD|nr:hypothetical protein [Kangiella koreensis]ACV27874.1 hypothetical protein Kkor_2465 [Kangiella koreensis DSM 16069]